MGISRWDPEDWDTYAAAAKSKSFADLFRNNSIDATLDPQDIIVRESCDSNLNPQSTPIIVAVDDTGSMGMLAETLIRNGLGTLIEEIYDRKPVPDPHVMCMAVGDAWCDRAPLQVTQFEADIRLADQLSKFFIEGGGGGNSYESYNLPWYFAATRTKCDAFLKRNKKGYLFTVGDEPPPPKLLAAHVKKIFGGGLQHDLSTREVLTMTCKAWNVFHIMIEEGNYFKHEPVATKRAWQGVLGENAVGLKDHTQLAQLIVSIIEVREGKNPDVVASSWSGNTSLCVRDSLSGLTNKPGILSSIKGLTRLF